MWQQKTSLTITDNGQRGLLLHAAAKKSACFVDCAGRVQLQTLFTQCPAWCIMGVGADESEQALVWGSFS